MSNYPKVLTRDGETFSVCNSIQEAAFVKSGWQPCKEKPQNADGLDGKTVEELKTYAAENGIDIGNATSASGILKKIRGS